MKKVKFKFLSGVITSALIVGAIGAPVASATTESKNDYVTMDNNLYSSSELTKQDFYEAFEIAIKESKNDFVDPSAADELLQKFENETEIESHGKITTTAKAGAKAIKKMMDKMGKKAWDQMVKKVESMTGQELVMFHWDTINGLLDFLVGSGDTITEAIQTYLMDWGFNSTIALVIAEAFVFFVF